jgi:hypothetical protein
MPALRWSVSTEGPGSYSWGCLCPEGLEALELLEALLSEALLSGLDKWYPIATPRSINYKHSLNSVLEAAQHYTSQVRARRCAHSGKVTKIIMNLVESPSTLFCTSLVWHI